MHTLVGIRMRNKMEPHMISDERLTSIAAEATDLDTKSQALISELIEAIESMRENIRLILDG